MEQNIQRLIILAQQAASRAYCPYSRYRVGAALLGADGNIYTGSNVENTSYGLSICAERAAVFHAVGAGERVFRMLVLVAGTKESPATPCGACRQVLVEFGSQDMLVVCAALDGSVTFQATLSELLPHGFSME